MGLFGRHKKRWNSLFGSSSSSDYVAPVEVVNVIVQDFPGQIGFRSSVISVTEGEIAHLQVERVGGASVAASVNWATAAIPGEAVAGINYTSGSGTLTWEAGDATPRYIDVLTSRITGYDGTLRFDVTLSLFVGSPAWNFRTQRVSILDADAQGTGPTYFRPTTLSSRVLENGTSITIQVMRMGSTEGAASIDLDATNGTALSGTHYTDTPATLSWADGEGGAKDFVVSIINVGGAGGNKIFYVDLANPVGGVVDDIYNQVEVTIIDDEGITSIPGQIDIQATLDIAESAGSTNVTVSRSFGSLGALSVSWERVDGTALGGTDFVAGSGTLTWADGDYTSKSITFTTIDNSLIRGNKTCSIVLSNVTGGATLGNATCAINLLEDDRISSFVVHQFGYWQSGFVENCDDWRYSQAGVLVRQIGLEVGVEIGPSRPQESYGGSSDTLSGGTDVTERTPTRQDYLQAI